MTPDDVASRLLRLDEPVDARAGGRVDAAVLVPPSFPAHPNQLGEIESARVVTATIQRVLAASGHRRG